MIDKDHMEKLRIRAIDSLKEDLTLGSGVPDIRWTCRRIGLNKGDAHSLIEIFVSNLFREIVYAGAPGEKDAVSMLSEWEIICPNSESLRDIAKRALKRRMCEIARGDIADKVEEEINND